MKDNNLVNRMRYGKEPLKDGMKNNRLITWPVAGFLLGFATNFNDRTIVTFLDILLSSMLMATAYALIGIIAALLATFIFKKRTSVFTDANYLAFLFPAATILLKLFGGDFAGFALIPAALFIWLLWHAKSIE
jgi:hypothetical protein